MKLDRLLDDYEFILKDPSQFKQASLSGPQYIRIKELRIRQINYDGFIQGEISTLSIHFSDSDILQQYHLHYTPGLIKGLEEFDKIIADEYNRIGSNQKEVFQKMFKLGDKYNFNVKNEKKFTYPSKSKTDVFKSNLKKLEEFLIMKKLNQKLSFTLINGEFHFDIGLKNGHHVFIRISSYDDNPQVTLEKISPFISKDIQKAIHSFGQQKTHFYFFNPNFHSKSDLAATKSKVLAKSLENLETFLRNKSLLK